MAKAKSGRKLWMVLCTDVLILTEEKHLYRMVSHECRERMSRRGDRTREK